MPNGGADDASHTVDAKHEPDSGSRTGSLTPLYSAGPACAGLRQRSRVPSAEPDPGSCVVAYGYGVGGGESTAAVRPSTWLRSCSQTLGALSLMLPGAIQRLFDTTCARSRSPWI
jgi:hypothetical protein